MQDQNKPGQQSSGPRSAASTTYPTGSDGPQSSAHWAQDELRRSAEEVTESVKNVAGNVKDEVAAAATDLRDQAAALAEPLQQKARSLADEQKQAGAERLGGVARAIETAAGELDDEMPQTAAWIRRGAAQLEQVSTSVREKSVEDLARDADRFARANTAAFFGLSLVAGFAVARFLKSAAPAPGTQASGTWSGTEKPQGRTTSPPLQPHPGRAAGTPPYVGTETGLAGRTSAFPHNEF